MRITTYGNQEPANPDDVGKTALCLCGGGLTGALFEVGVMAALDEVRGEAASTHFDLFVGSSAGASVSSILAQNVGAERLFSALRDPDDPYFPIRREDVYKMEARQWVRAAGRIASAAARVIASQVRGSDERLIDDLAGLNDYLPAGLFRLDRYEAFLAEFYTREGLASQFSEVTKELYIVANDVDLAKRVVFGDPDTEHVPVAQAVAASSAIPVFFEPVAIEDRDYIDGGVGRVSHIDVAIERGASRVLVVNPVVPVCNDTEKVCLPSRHGRCARMRDKGLLFIGNQAYRIANKARLHFGIKRYVAEHPHVQVILVEPRDEETLMFLNGSMDLRARREILDYARRGARTGLEQLLDEQPEQSAWLQ